MQEFALAAVNSPWLYLLVVVSVMGSAFFPPLPSTSLVVGLSAYSAATGSPNIWLLALAMLAGSVGGDALLYAVASRFEPDSWRILRAPAAKKALDRARHGLEHRPAVFIVAARFIPLGRLTVNLTAGVSRVSSREFLALAFAAGVFWAGYSTAIGYLSGNWLEAHPIIGIVIAVVVSILLGYLLGKLVTWLLDKWGARPGSSHPADGERQPAD